MFSETGSYLGLAFLDRDLVSGANPSPQANRWCLRHRPCHHHRQPLSQAFDFHSFEQSSLHAVPLVSRESNAGFVLPDSVGAELTARLVKTPRWCAGGLEHVSSLDELLPSVRHPYQS